MSYLKKATPETSMNEIVDRFTANGQLSKLEMAEMLYNAFRLIRRLENTVLAQTEEKRAIDAEKMARVAERKEVDTEAMRVIRKEQDRQQAERERIAAADGFMAALDAELLKDDAPAAPAPIAKPVIVAQPAPATQQAAPAPVKAPAQPTATSQAAAALKAQVDERGIQRARPAAPAPTPSLAPAAPARAPNTRGAFTGGMPRNSFGG